MAKTNMELSVHIISVKVDLLWNHTESSNIYHRISTPKFFSPTGSFSENTLQLWAVSYRKQHILCLPSTQKHWIPNISSSGYWSLYFLSDSLISVYRLILFTFFLSSPTNLTICYNISQSHIFQNTSKYKLPSFSVYTPPTSYRRMNLGNYAFCVHWFPIDSSSRYTWWAL